MRLEPHVLTDQTPPAMRDDLGRSLTDLDGISATFDAILRLSRMQAGLVSLQVEAFDIVPLVRDLAEMLGAIQQKTQVTASPPTCRQLPSCMATATSSPKSY